MSSVFEEVLKRRNMLLHEVSVYAEILEHLTVFVDSDSSKATTGVSTSGDGIVVPQSVINKVIVDVRRHKDDLEAVIGTVDSMEVLDGNSPARKAKATRKKTVSRKTTRKAPRKKVDRKPARKAPKAKK